jgi:hypothetical protein
MSPLYQLIENSYQGQQHETWGGTRMRYSERRSGRNKPTTLGAPRQRCNIYIGVSLNQPGFFFVRFSFLLFKFILGDSS